MKTGRLRIRGRECEKFPCKMELPPRDRGHPSQLCPQGSQLSSSVLAVRKIHLFYSFVRIYKIQFNVNVYLLLIQCNCIFTSDLM